MKHKTSIIFNFGWMKLIGGMSVILFLFDFSRRTGKWWFELIAIFFVITTFGAIVKEIIKSKEWKEESYYSRLKQRWEK